MLIDRLISGKQSASCVVLIDSVDQSGFLLLKYISSQMQSVVCCFENHPTFFQPQKTIDFFTDPLGLLGEKMMTNDSFLRIPQQNTECIVFYSKQG